MDSLGDGYTYTGDNSVTSDGVSGLKTHRP